MCGWVWVKNTGQLLQKETMGDPGKIYKSWILHFHFIVSMREGRNQIISMRSAVVWLKLVHTSRFAIKKPVFVQKLPWTVEIQRVWRVETFSLRFKWLIVALCLQCSWPGATASPSMAWRACASSSSPPRPRRITCRWLTPATTCWTCPATRPKRSCAAASLRPWSSTRASAWSEEGVGGRSAKVLTHFNSNTRVGVKTV